MEFSSIHKLFYEMPYRTNWVFQLFIWFVVIFFGQLIISSPDEWFSKTFFKRNTYNLLASSKEVPYKEECSLGKFLSDEYSKMFIQIFSLMK